MKFLTIIGNAIWAKLEPLLTARLDSLEKDAKDELTALRGDVMTRLDKLEADTMTMLKTALPEMAGEVSEQAVKTIFANTHIDEAANSVSDVFTDILGRFHLP
jgi:hypothetical protein